MADTLEPRQIEFLKNYLDPKSETFSNALQTALKVGYTQEYAENITSLMPDWLSENIGNEKMVRKAEKNLEKAMDLPLEDKDLGKMNLEASKFVASRLGKKKWSERQELTGAEGKPIITVSEEILKKYELASNTSNGGEGQASL